MNIHYRELYLFDNVPLQLNTKAMGKVSIYPSYSKDLFWTEDGQKQFNQVIELHSKSNLYEPTKELYVFIVKWNTGRWDVWSFSSEPEIVN